jgi:tRNA A-37 threonylcarbamoyl transferase component Bud32
MSDPKKLTRAQYRHLRKSLEILKDNKVSHGDLVGNVMLHPKTNLPIIIDFDEGSLGASDTELKIDYQAFMTHFKVAPRK